MVLKFKFVLKICNFFLRHPLSIECCYSVADLKLYV